MPPTPPPAGRFLVAFDSDTLDTTPAWTRLDNHPNLVTSYTIDRGRQYELDRTDAARATVEIADRDGLLDPTNPAGPYYNKIWPLKQAMIGRQNPVDGTWHTRFRGFVAEIDYSFDPSQQVNRLTVELSDIYEHLASIELQPFPFFGSLIPEDPDFPGQPNPDADQVFYFDERVNERIKHILCNCFGETYVAPSPPDPPPARPPISDAFSVVFTGNVQLWGAFYGRGDSAMSAIQEAADGEFPGVANVYTDSRGRLVFHGRLARFDPTGVSSGVSDDVWDYHQFRAGDLDAHIADPPMSRIRSFGFNRGMSKIINRATALPQWVNKEVLDSGHTPTRQDVLDGTVENLVSQGKYGIRSWSAENLLTRFGYLSDTTPDGSPSRLALGETVKFAEYYVVNFAEVHNRVTDIGFRSIRVGQPGAQETWRLLCTVDISDHITVTVGSPGGGGFDHEPYFVEGVHETCRPGSPGATTPPPYPIDDVEVTLDLSPQAYYDTNPWA